MDLGMLNQSSAKVGTFAVRVYEPQIVEWEYDYKGQKKTGRRFSCTLLGKKQGSYCEATVKGAPAKIDEALKKYKHGEIYLLSKVRLNARAKTEYINTDLKIEVAMDLSTFALVVGGGTDQPAAALPLPYLTPQTTCAEIVGIQGRRRFDIVGLVRSTAEQRSVVTPSGPKQVMDVSVVDGTKEADSTCELTVPFWSPPCKLPTVAEAQGKVVLLQGLQAHLRTDGLHVSTTDVTKVTLATEDMLKHGKYAEVSAAAAALVSLPQSTLKGMCAEFVPGSGGESKWPFDVEQGSATLSTCGLLDAMADQVTIGNSEPQLLQLHDVRLDVPEGQVTTEDGNRIWFVTTARDWTGSTRLGVSEAAALVLCGGTSKEEFLVQAQSEGLEFPMLVNLRVVRTVRSKADSAQEKVVSAVIVTATEAPVTVLPTKAVEALMPLLALCQMPTDGWLPARLSQVAKCPYHGLRVNYEGHHRAARYVMALVESGNKSTLTEMGSGYQVTTKGVTAPGLDAQAYELVAFCTLDAVMDFRLDPVKAGATKKRNRKAIVLISGLDASTFVIEALQLLEPEQEEAAVHRLEILAEMAAAMTGTDAKQGGKRHVEWIAEDATPLN